MLVDLRSCLLSHASITALIADRLHYASVPRGIARPCVTYRRVSEEHGHDLDGASGVVRARVQFDVWTDTPADVNSIAEAIRLMLDGYSGTHSGTEFMEVFLDNIADLPEPPSDGSQNWTYHLALDFIVRYRVSLPEF